MLEIKNLSKVFRGSKGIIKALDNVSLTVQVGEFVVVQGPSGSGKTTLLLSAGGLLSPSEGQVMINNQNLYKMSADERAYFRATNIGFVFQQFYLVSYLNILDNILSPSLAVSRQKSRERAEELIEHFNLKDRINHIPSELSTGERQRTALARALLNDPKLLLADEPVGNLDNENAEIVINYLKECAISGVAVLLVTHSDRAVKYAHRILQLKEGKII